MTAHDDMPRDPALSRRYREAGGAANEAGMAPPPALDARILAAAHEAVRRAPQAVARSWWRRLTLPVGVLATTVFAVMLALTMQRHPPGTQEAEGESPVPASAAKPAPAPAAPAAEAAKGAAQLTEPAPAAGRTDKAPAARSERAAAVAERKTAPAPAAPAGAAAPMPPPATVPAAAPPAAQPADASPPVANEAAAKSLRLKSEADADRAGERLPEAESRLRMQRAPQPAAAAPPGESGRQAAKDAQAWIEEIRELKRLGRNDEAARRLAEFRRTYPAYVLPEDLQRE